MYSLLGGVPDPNYLSVRAGWCVQWLDRCLWISQSIALMELGAFQEEGEDVTGGPELIRSILVRGHLWNFLFFFFTKFTGFCMVSWDLQLCEQQPRFQYEVLGTNGLWSAPVVFYPFCVRFQPTTVVLTLEIYYRICSLQCTLTCSHIEQGFLLSMFFYYLSWVLKIILDAM